MEASVLEANELLKKRGARLQPVQIHIGGLGNGVMGLPIAFAYAGSTAFARESQSVYLKS